MDIIRHGNHFRPAGARTPGGASYPKAVEGKGLPALPAIEPSARTVAVGVVDTGIVLDRDSHQPHPWFAGHVTFGEHDDDPLEQGHRDRYEPHYLADADGHGTFVTGLILNEAQTAQIIMRGVLDKGDAQRARGLDSRDDAAVAEAVRRLGADDAVQVINLSFAGGVFEDGRNAAGLAEVLRDLPGRIAVVAAAGNDASDTPTWPAAFERVIAVGALDLTATHFGGPPLAQFSNCGSWVNAYASGVDVLGPFVTFKETGSDVYGIHPPQDFTGWATWSGTSFAAAIVSGRIAQTAIKQGISGQQAADLVLGQSPNIFDGNAVWVGAPAKDPDGTDSP